MLGVLPKDIVPYRLLFSELVDAYRPGDIIFVNPLDSRGVEFRWQSGHQFSTEMRYSLVGTIEEALPARRIWYLTPQWLDEGVRATFAQIEQTHPLQQAFGKCDVEWCYLFQLMEAPPWSSPQVFGEHMAFWGADIDSVSPELIQTRLWWKVEQTPSQDYSMSLQVFDENGALVANADGPINHYKKQVFNTSQLLPEQIYIDFRDVAISPRLSPGSYRLALVVYNWQTNERLPLPDGADHLELGTVQVN
jgi:hypothetical protein